MKNVLWTLSCFVLLGGCSHQNAFTNFAMQQEQERGVASLQHGKITKGNEVFGIFSAIYLNEVYPQTYNVHEYFLLSLYVKEKQHLHDPNSFEDQKLSLRLNGKEAIKIKPLDKGEEFTAILFSQTPWVRYYLVAFNEEPNNELTLSLVGEELHVKPFLYEKNQE